MNDKKIILGLILVMLLPVFHYSSLQGAVIKGDQPMDEIIMSLENGAMERWRKGDVWGWTEISDERIIYVDPGLTVPIEGLEAYKEYLKPFEGKIDYQISEFIDPKIKRYDDLAVLTYNYRDAKTEEDGSIIEQSLWNTTEVYCFREGNWKIIHTHWSYIDQKLPERTEVPVLVRQPSIEYEGLLGELMALESAAMERWRKGDPRGFIDISAQEVTYFDTGTPKRLDGLEALKTEYANCVDKIHYDVMEFIDPKILVHGNAAVLFYRFFSTHLNPDGSIASRIPWNCTEVFSKIDGNWKIVHTHWSFINGEVNL
jgi:ketosteroid isomerase-like protein